MAIEVAPYEASHVDAVKAFNQRLRAGGAPSHFVIPEGHDTYWLRRQGKEPVFNELFLAIDGDEVRGAYNIKYQDFWFRGQRRRVGYFHHPYSEGLVNPAYALVGPMLVQDALQRQPLLHALGMDGYDGPLPKILTYGL